MLLVPLIFAGVITAEEIWSRYEDSAWCEIEEASVEVRTGR